MYNTIKIDNKLQYIFLNSRSNLPQNRHTPKKKNQSIATFEIFYKFILSINFFL